MICRLCDQDTGLEADYDALLMLLSATGRAWVQCKTCGNLILYGRKELQLLRHKERECTSC